MLDDVMLVRSCRPVSCAAADPKLSPVAQIAQPAQLTLRNAQHVPKKDIEKEKCNDLNANNTKKAS